jgi:hypothetical protein
MAKKNPLNKDLKEVIKELPKAPGGNVAQPRPLVPGGIQGGPPLVTSSIPGATPAGPTGEVFTKSDPARDLFKFYKTGVDRPLDMPAEPVDLETIEEKKVKPTGAKGSKKTQERLEIAKGVRGGTIGGMTRAPGSKPSLAKSLPMAIEIAMERTRRRIELETIQESLRDALIVERGEKTTTYVSDPNSPKAGGITRDEQKIIDRAAQAARDALLDRDAAIREAVMLRDVTTGEVNPLAQSVTQSEADRRALEGMKAFEETVGKKPKTKKPTSTPKPPIVGGRGLAAFGAVGLALDAALLWKQFLQETETQQQQIQSETMN